MARYWVGGTGNWSDDTNHWATASGGTPGTGNLPTASDDVIFDSASSASSYTVTIVTTQAFCNNLTWGNPASGNPTFAGSTSLNISGSASFPSGMTATFSSAINFLSTGAGTLTTNGVQFACTISNNGIGGSFSLLDDLIMTGASLINPAAGTFNTNNHNITTRRLICGNQTKTMNLGSSVITIYGSLTNSITSVASGTTFNAGTSTFILNDTTPTNKSFDGGGQTFHNFEISGSGTGNFQILGSNIFNDFKIDTPPNTVLFTAGTTNTFTTFTVSGTAGNLITIGSVTAATHTLAKAGGGTISSDYLSVSESIATPGTTWYAGTHSMDGGSNLGWVFTAPPAPAKTFDSLLLAGD
jgi:hypothetical protein